MRATDGAKSRNSLGQIVALFGPNRRVVWAKSFGCLGQIVRLFGPNRNTTDYQSFSTGIKSYRATVASQSVCATVLVALAPSGAACLWTDALTTGSDGEGRSFQFSKIMKISDISKFLWVKFRSRVKKALWGFIHNAGSFFPRQGKCPTARDFEKRDAAGGYGHETIMPRTTVW